MDFSKTKQDSLDELKSKTQEPLQMLRFAVRQVQDAIGVAEKIINIVSDRYPNGISMYNPATHSPSDYIKKSDVVQFYSKDGDERHLTGVCGPTQISFIQISDNRETFGVMDIGNVYPPDIIIVASQLAEALLK